MNAAVQFVMPASAIAGSPQPASAAMALALGRWGAGIVSVGMALSMLVCLNGNMMTGARIPFAMSRDRCFFDALAQVHPRFRTPSTAIAVQAALAVALMLLCPELPAVVLAHSICRVRLLHGGDGVGIYFSRQRTRTPYARTIPGDIRWFPSCSSLPLAMLLYYSFRADVKYSLLEIAMIAAGLPFYLYFAAKRSSR